MNEKKSYYAVIPASVRYEKKLNANAKLLYGEITALCNEKGYCWASNSYFADLYEVVPETISRWISKLKNLGFIEIEIIYKENTKEILERHIYISDNFRYPIDEKINTPRQKDQDPIDENVNTPIDEKIKDNNTYINNTYNIYCNSIINIINHWLYISNNNKGIFPKHKIYTLNNRIKKIHIDKVKNIGEQEVINAINNLLKVIKNENCWINYAPDLWEFLGNSGKITVDSFINDVFIENKFMKLGKKKNNVQEEIKRLYG